MSLNVQSETLRTAHTLVRITIQQKALHTRLTACMLAFYNCVLQSRKTVHLEESVFAELRTLRESPQSGTL